MLWDDLLREGTVLRIRHDVQIAGRLLYECHNCNSFSRGMSRRAQPAIAKHEYLIVVFPTMEYR